MEEKLKRKMKTLAQIEKEFDKYMALNGFTRVSEDVGDSPGFSNADYVNKSRRILVELKIIDKEFFPNGGMIHSLNGIVVQPKDIEENGLGQYTFSLPDKNRKGKNDNFEEPLRRTIKTANKQLKTTKEIYLFNLRPSLSFVLIAQVGLTSLSADVTAQIVRKILNQEFSGIDGAIVCVPYFKSKNPITLGVNPECVSITRDDDIVKRYVCMELADKWINFLESGGHK